MQDTVSTSDARIMETLTNSVNPHGDRQFMLSSDQIRTKAPQLERDSSLDISSGKPS